MKLMSLPEFATPLDEENKLNLNRAKNEKKNVGEFPSRSAWVINHVRNLTSYVAVLTTLIFIVGIAGALISP